MSQVFADRVLQGRIRPNAESTKETEALALVGGNIIALGSSVEIQGLIGPDTSVEEVTGVVFPAFQDAHIHLVEGSLFDIRCDLHGLEGEAITARIAEYARALAADAWVRGGGWSMDDFSRRSVTRHDLDAVCGERPAYLTARDGHSVWVSSRTLELAGITSETPDPEGGRIERFVDGSPTGILHETAMKLLAGIVPETSDEEFDRAFDLGQSYLHSLGITAWQDARIERDLLQSYLRAEQQGRLQSRVVLALAWDRSRGIEQITELQESRALLGSSRLITAPFVKLFVDGVLENRTAFMNDEYADHAGVGDPLYTSAELEQIVHACTLAGFGVHFHAVGDGAVTAALDACETVNNALVGHGMRHQICHLQSVHPSDLPRFAKLNVIANLQMLWACSDSQMLELCLPGLGESRYEQQYPFRSLKKQGAVLAAGSDWRVSTPDPLAQIQVAVTRVPIDEPESAPLAPSEALTVRDAIGAFTSGAAFANGLEMVSGSLEVGKSADLVVLDSDPHGAPPHAISEISVTATMFAGEWTNKTVKHADLANESKVDEL